MDKIYFKIYTIWLLQDALRPTSLIQGGNIHNFPNPFSYECKLYMKYVKRFISARKSVDNRYQSMSVEVLFIVRFEHRTYLSVYVMHIKHVVLLLNSDLGKTRQNTFA